MTPETDPEPQKKKKKRFEFPTLPKLEWYWVTRTTGLIMVFYGMLFDQSTERGTLVITGAGLIGVDKVLRPPSSG